MTLGLSGILRKMIADGDGDTTNSKFIARRSSSLCMYKNNRCCRRPYVSSHYASLLRLHRLHLARFFIRTYAHQSRLYVLYMLLHTPVAHPQLQSEELFTVGCSNTKSPALCICMHLLQKCICMRHSEKYT